MKLLSKIVMLFCILFSFISLAQIGKVFPSLNGKSLDGNVVSLPVKLTEKNTIVCIIYSQKTEKALSTWMQPLANTFLVKNPLDPEPYDVNLYFVVLLSGIKDLASDAIEARFKKALGRDYYKNIIIYQGSIKPYTSELEFGKKDEPYFCVIEKNGNISYSTVGLYTAEKLQEIENAIAK